MRLGVLHLLLRFCFPVAASLRSCGILTDLVFVSVLLLRLALVTGQELLPLVRDGDVELGVHPVDAADVNLPRPVLDDEAGSFPAFADQEVFLLIVLAPIEEVVVALENVVAYDWVIAVVKRLVPLNFAVAEVLGESTGVLLLDLPRHFDLEVTESSQLLKLLLALLFLLLLLGQQLLVQLLGLPLLLGFLAEPPLLDLLGGVVLFKLVLFMVPPQLLLPANGGGVGLGSEAPLLSLLTDLNGRVFDMLVQ